MSLQKSVQKFSSASFRSARLASRLIRGARAGLLGLALVVVGSAVHAQAYVSGSIGAQIAPGVYGRVDIGNAPAPALIYQQPVLVAPPPVAVQAAPVYMYVPPGHARNWRKYCGRYGACGQRVYFLKEPYRGHRVAPPPPPHWRERDRSHDRWDHDRRDHGPGRHGPGRHGHD